MWNAFFEFLIGKPEKPGEQAERENENWVRLLRIILLTSAVAVFAMGISWTAAGGLSIAKGIIGLLVAACALFVGGLMGFLFGIPRAQSGQGAVMEENGKTRDQIRRNYNENTNLEQISDWLTKIIVGVSLIQFRGIFESLSGFAEKVAPAFLPESTGAAAGSVAMAFMIFYAIHGFFFAYMWTRVYMIRVLKRANRPIMEEIEMAQEERERNDVRARIQVSEYFEASVNSQQVDIAKLKTLIGAATKKTRVEIFFDARKFRKKSVENSDLERVERCIPVFEALIEGDAGYHRNHAQLAYTLLDKKSPDLPRAIDELKTAIAQRDAEGKVGYELYEMVLADAIVRSDQGFMAGKKSTAQIVVQVGNYLSKGANVVDISGFADLQKWSKMNG